MPVYSLTELNQHIRETLENEYPEAIWIRAEVFSFQVNAMSGHCYLELADGQARAKAMIWKKTYEILSRKFQIQTGMAIQKGIAIQVLVKVEFNIQYGLSMVVWDVDTEYSLGEKAKKRAETLRKLENENLIRKNGLLHLPALVQHFAIISSPTAAGYQDFITHLKENIYGFAFGFQLFEARMQGTEAVDSIVMAFEKVEASGIPFEAIILIRGGGSAADLLVFDEYEVAKRIANCPIPVLTGIGHERDDAVADQVAYQKFKTPTAVADFLLEKLMEADQTISEWVSEICRRIQGQWQQQWFDFQNVARECHLKLQKGVFQNEKETGFWIQKTGQKAADQIRKMEEGLRVEETRIFEMNPISILKKGYAMVDQSGKRSHALGDLDARLPFTLRMKDGKKEARLSES